MSQHEADLQRLELLFRRASSLPELPGNVLRLIQAIDTGEASAKDLERIISTDPGLSANLLRVSNTRVPGVEPPGISTIRAAIMRLGQRSVRTLAVSLMLQHVSHGKDTSPEFNVDRFARHSLLVAFLARYLFARRNLSNRFESRWTADEIFAGGLLHDIGMALLAQVAPDAYFRVASFAKRTQVSLETSFFRIFGCQAASLARSAIDAWALPELFGSTVAYGSEPWNFPAEYTALCCLNYANHLAQIHGAATEDWEFPTSLLPEVEAEVSLQPDEEEKVMAFVTGQVETYLSASEKAAA